MTIASTVAGLCLGLGVSEPAFASPPVACDPTTGICTVQTRSPGHQGRKAFGPKAPRAAGKSKCMLFGKPIACRDGVAWWSNSRLCYVQFVSPQPGRNDPVWVGHSGGAVYSCYSPWITVGIRMYYFWSARVPAGPAAPPDPQALARQAIARMSLRAIRIGIVPSNAPGKVGLVGMPQWLWAVAPDQHSWGPITRRASAGGVTVSATARVSRVRWEMGDGGVVVCAGPGTPYEARFGRSPSPDCGYRYARQGTYTVRATSYWTVTWSGMGLSGTIPLQLRDSTVVTMGELQVITEAGGR